MIPMMIFAQQNLTLDQCRELALENNHQIKIAEENIQSAEHGVKSSRTAFLPKISLVGSYTRMNKKFKYSIDEMALPISNADGTYTADQLNVITNADGSATMTPKNWIHIPSMDLKIGQENIYLLDLALVQPLFMGGKIMQQYNISKSAAKISKAQKSLTNSEVLVKTDEYYWQIVSVEHKLELAHEYVNLINTHITELEEYMVEGLITNNDMLKAKVKLNEAKINLLKAENGCALLKMALYQHIGLPLKSQIKLADNEFLEYSSVNSDIDDDEFLSSREELKILQESVNISKSLEKIAYSQYMPNVVITSNYYTLNPNPYNSLKDEFGSDWNVGISAQFDIFGWNDRGHKVAIARHSRKAAEQQFEDSKNMIRLDIQQATYRISESMKQIYLADATFVQADENLRVTQDNFKEGLTTSTDVLDAQILWQKSKSEAIDSKSEYRINLSKYYKAIGQK